MLEDVHPAVLGEGDQGVEFAAGRDDERGGLIDQDLFAIEEADRERTERFAARKLFDSVDTHGKSNLVGGAVWRNFGCGAIVVDRRR